MKTKQREEKKRNRIEMGNGTRQMCENKKEEEEEEQKH